MLLITGKHGWKNAEMYRNEGGSAAVVVVVAVAGGGSCHHFS